MAAPKPVTQNLVLIKRSPNFTPKRTPRGSDVRQPSQGRPQYTSTPQLVDKHCIFCNRSQKLSIIPNISCLVFECREENVSFTLKGCTLFSIRHTQNAAVPKEFFPNNVPPTYWHFASTKLLVWKHLSGNIFFPRGSPFYFARFCFEEEAIRAQIPNILEISANSKCGRIPCSTWGNILLLMVGNVVKAKW